MRNDTYNSDILDFAQKSTYELLKAFEEAHNKAPNTIKDKTVIGANLVNTIAKALHSNNPIGKLENLARENEDIKDNSSIIIKIKQFLKSIIRLLKSPFTTRAKEELDEVTKSAVKDISDLPGRTIQRDENTHNITTRPKSLAIESQEQQHLSSVQTEVQANSTQLKNGNVSTPPPPPPPPPSPINGARVMSDIDRAEFLASVIKGVKLKNVRDRKLSSNSQEDVSSPASGLMNELTKVLKRNNSKKSLGSGDEYQTKDSTASRKFLDDLKSFEEERKKEEQRLKDLDKKEEERVQKNILREQAEKASQENAKKLDTLSKPVIVVKPGEIPPPPPPPPLSLPHVGIKVNNKVKSHSNSMKDRSNKNELPKPGFDVKPETIISQRNKLKKPKKNERSR